MEWGNLKHEKQKKNDKNEGQMQRPTGGLKRKGIAGGRDG